MNIDRTLADLEYMSEHLVPRLIRNLKWARNTSYGRLALGVHQKGKNQRPKKMAPGDGDETGNVVVGAAQERLKEAVRSAQHQIKEASAILDAVDKDLEKSFRRADRYERLDNTLKPPLISPQEEAEAIANQRKREAAGGGYGQS